ncbi:MAG: MBL fold metallo-hydrolase [Planctomycetota bacterium]|jgi:glyoxylase-like metal-dependent hydrolase (beta-lactamase superfamily II)
MRNPKEDEVGVLRIDRAVLGPFETNCYLVRVGEGSEARAWLVDAGFAPSALLAMADDAGVVPEAVVLTHAHADHIGGLAEVRARYPEIPIWIHEAEREWLTDPELNLSALHGVPLVMPEATRLLRDGEVLELGGVRFDVLHTPGHSPGGITLHAPEHAVALVGDTLFEGSIGRFDFPTSDERALFSSIRDVLYALGDETRVLPGHMGETTIGREKRTNPFVRGL